jgi:hypothetical protein
MIVNIMYETVPIIRDSLSPKLRTTGTETKLRIAKLKKTIPHA